MTATLMKRAHEAQASVQVSHIDKWALFRDLCTARFAFEVSDRDLTVLNALLSFHQSKTLSDNESLIVYPSNKKLSERAHGMAESTLRRHLGALGRAGLIQRHDSPNGKRYVARGQGGETIRAFGFDLRPLLVRAKDIARASLESKAAADHLRRLREEVIILKRDALKLCQYGQEHSIEGDWATIEGDLLTVHKKMRRKLTRDELNELLTSIKLVMNRLQSLLNTEEMNGSDLRNERHYQNSSIDSSVFEPCLEKPKAEVDHSDDLRGDTRPKEQPNVPVSLVVKACPDILPYAESGIRNWRDLIDVAEFVRGMM
jgi:replication initiation protein RepC